ncbi:hypothetical protein R1flu_018640 [Riccia fluitans]|uniref:Uncharacterized protein n=1 Tax=Riccia fluitans TaxID=41844 RepID=A0ABD1ZHG9_9MARC
MTDLGKVSHFLGIHVDYKLETGTLKLSQKAYILLKLARFNLSTAASKETPMIKSSDTGVLTVVDVEDPIPKRFTASLSSASADIGDPQGSQHIVSLTRQTESSLQLDRRLDGACTRKVATYGNAGSSSSN